MKNCVFLCKPVNFFLCPELISPCIPHEKKKKHSQTNLLPCLVLSSLCPSSFCRGQKCCVQVMPAGSKHRELHRAVLQLQGLNCWLELNYNRMSVHCIDSDSGLFSCVLGLLPFLGFFFLFSSSIEVLVPFIVPSLTY